MMEKSTIKIKCAFNIAEKTLKKIIIKTKKTTHLKLLAENLSLQQ